MHSTERAALRLALGVLRQVRPYRHEGWRRGDAVDDALTDAADVLAAADLWGIAPEFDVRDEERPNKHGYPSGWPAYSPRILRCRLALYLRAVLRAEAADEWERTWNGAPPPRWVPVCDACREPLPWWTVGERVGAPTTRPQCKGARVRWPRPLWLDAPTRAR